MLEQTDATFDLHAQWPPAPFPGLRPFQSRHDPDESLIFYGRNREKDEILARLNTSHLVFIVGPSGCGKSSLVKVGVLPALEAGLLTRAGTDWRTAEMRPGDRPLRNLATALATFAATADPTFADKVHDVLCNENNGIWLVAEMLATRTITQPLVVLIDQFEEIFGPQVSSRDECKCLLDAIIDFAAKPHPNLYLITTMRTDFLGACANFPKLADVINQTLFVTPVLRDEDLKDVITLPVEDYHGEAEPELVSTIVKDASSQLGYNPDHLPLLQHALLWLWNRSVADAGLADCPPRPGADAPARPVLITHRMYVEHKALKGILNEHADDLYRGLDDRQKRIAEALFRRISERDAENRYRRSPAAIECIATLAECDPAEVRQVVAKFSHPDVSFVECRQLADRSGEFVDLSHESLIRQWDRLRAWADDEAEKLRRYRNLAGAAAEWQRQGRPDNFLKSGGELEVHERWWHAHQPTATWAARYRLDSGDYAGSSVDLTRAYLTSSRKRQDMRVLRRRLLLAALAAAAVVSPVVLQWISYSATLAALRVSQSHVLAARGEELVQRESPTLGLLVALDALAGNVEYTPDLERLAYLALQGLHAKVVISAKNQFPTATFSPDGRTLLYSNSQQLKFWNVAARKPIASLMPRDVSPNIRAKWSDDGNWIVSSSIDNQTVLWAPCSLPAVRPLFPSCDESATDRVRQITSESGPTWPSVLSPKSHSLLTGGWGVPAKFWDLAHTPPAPVPLDAVSVGFALAFNSAATLFAIGATDGSVRVHPVADPKHTLANLRVPRLGDPSPTRSISMEKDAVFTLPVSSVAFSPTNSDRLVAVTTDGVATLWDVKSGQIVGQLSTGSSGWTNVAFDRTGILVALTSQDGVVRIWNPVTKGTTLLVGHRQSTWSVEFNRDADLLVSASGDSVRVWDPTAALAPSRLDGSPRMLGVTTISTSSGVATLTVADTAGATTLALPRSAPAPIAAALSSDGRRVLIAEPSSLKLYTVEKKLDQPLATFKMTGVEWRAAGFLQNPDRLVGETTDGRYYTWPYFKDLKALQTFAADKLPVDEFGRKAELSDNDKCRFGLLSRDACRAEKIDTEASSSVGTPW